MTEAAKLRPTRERRQAPLAHLGGDAPDAPDWFKQALALQPERGYVEAAGARIETLCWGDSGRPGLLLCHGNAANADLWRFVAPFFAARRRVVALSWSGMGRSSWRADYSVATFAEEAMTVAAHFGMFEPQAKPMFVGHSAGGGPVLYAAHHWGHRLGGAVLVDSRVLPPEEAALHQTGRTHPVYATLPQALAHYRFVPDQPCENLFIADMLARASLAQIGGGWTWRFDPVLWRNFRIGSIWPLLGSMKCPVAIMCGEKSSLMAGDVLPRMLREMSPQTTCLMIPEAHHHVMIDQPLAFIVGLRSLLEQL
jgi:pimeloyl-ACP methyl ester carboxylesterase